MNVIWYFSFSQTYLVWQSLSGEGDGTPLQHSCLENPMNRGAWKAAVHGVTEGHTQLSNFTFNFHFHALEKEMATHSSVLAWRIPGTGEPGGLPSMGSHRVRHDWSDLATAAPVLSMLLHTFFTLSPDTLFSWFFPNALAISSQSPVLIPLLLLNILIAHGLKD